VEGILTVEVDLAMIDFAKRVSFHLCVWDVEGVAIDVQILDVV